MERGRSVHRQQPGLGARATVTLVISRSDHTGTSKDRKGRKMKNLLTTQNQNCYRQMIEKEAYTRLAWKTKYGQDYPNSFTSRRRREPSLPKLTAAKTALPPIVKTPEKRTEVRVEPAVASLSGAPLMRPVTPETREVLYQGISKEGKGRCLYLQKRTKKCPEDKFDFPQLSSWEYGWKLGNWNENYRSPVNGRSAIVRSTFYARNGIFNFPSPTDRLG